MWHAWEREENCTRFWVGKPEGKRHWEDKDVDGSMGLERILGKLAAGACVGVCVCVRAYVCVCVCVRAVNSPGSR
jgi:hypothetical protein